VKHFHEQLVKRHHYKLGYAVTKASLQAAGLVTLARRRGARSRQRWRPCAARLKPAVSLHEVAAWLAVVHCSKKGRTRAAQFSGPPSMRFSESTVAANAYALVALPSGVQRLTSLQCSDYRGCSRPPRAGIPPATPDRYNGSAPTRRYADCYPAVH
jgi:hypothetical protein